MLAASTAAFGLASLLRKLAVDRISPLHYQVIAASVYVMFLPFYVMLAVRYAPPQAQIDWRGVVWAVVGTTVASFGGIMFGYALKAGNDAGVGTSLSAASPIITIMLSFLLLGERPTASSALGCLLVLLGIIVIAGFR
jgi:uncharacterized membrane protein